MTAAATAAHYGVELDRLELLEGLAPDPGAVTAEELIRYPSMPEACEPSASSAERRAARHRFRVERMDAALAAMQADPRLSLEAALAPSRAEARAIERTLDALDALEQAR